MNSFLPIQEIVHSAWNQHIHSHEKVVLELDSAQKEFLLDEMQRLTKSISAAIECGDQKILLDYLGWLRRTLEQEVVSVDIWSQVIETIFEQISDSLETLTGDVFQEIHGLKQLALEHLRHDSSPLTSFPEAALEAKDMEGLAGSLIGGKQLFPYDMFSSAKIQGAANYEYVAQGLIQPSMYYIGDLWEQGKIGTLQEQMAILSAKAILAQVKALSPSLPRKGRKVLLSCAPGNNHELGLKMIEDRLDLGGFDTNNLGAGATMDDILKHIDRDKPELVGLSVCLSRQIPELKRAMDIIRVEFTQHRPFLMVGGLVLNITQTTASEVHADVKVRNLEGLSEVIS